MHLFLIIIGSIIVNILFFCYNFLCKGGDLVGYLALYRKYRPHNFSDLVGQSEVVNIIKNEILHDRISHAYLFSGPRGTGKTSTAKIIAKMINCSNLKDDGTPCCECESCVNFDSSSDIVEIDAASNNGVDEIRDLRDKVNLVPTYGKYKIYIIDEVHMLTTQAFNALLKTLEEPPAHIVFILATTEFYKIPITVVSRCQKFQFLKFSNDVIVDRLKHICSLESIDASDAVLMEIARLSDGGMRDAINMLDQLSSFSDNKISLEDVYKLNGVLSFEEFSDLLGYICSKEFANIVDFVDNIDKNGKNLNRFIGDFLEFLKDFLIFKSNTDYSSKSVENDKIFNKLSDKFSVDDIYSLIISVNDLSNRLHSSSFSKILIVTEFIKLANDFGLVNEKNVVNNNQVVNDNKARNNNDLNDKINSFVTNISDRDKMVRINNAFVLASKSLKEAFIDKWKLVVEKVLNDSNYFSVSSMINDIDIMVVSDKYIIFVAKYDSLVDRLFEHILIIEKLLFDVYNNNYKVVFLANDEWIFEKDKYVKSIKSGKKYELIDDNDINSDANDDLDTDVNKIVSILGNDVISYE